MRRMSLEFICLASPITTFAFGMGIMVGSLFIEKAYLNSTHKETTVKTVYYVFSISKKKTKKKS